MTLAHFAFPFLWCKPVMKCPVLKLGILRWSYERSYQHGWNDVLGWKSREISEDGSPLKDHITTAQTDAVYNHLYQFWMNRNVQFHSTIHILWKTQWSTKEKWTPNFSSPKEIWNPSEATYSWELQKKKNIHTKHLWAFSLLIFLLNSLSRISNFKMHQLE